MPSITPRFYDDEKDIDKKKTITGFDKDKTMSQSVVVQNVGKLI